MPDGGPPGEHPAGGARQGSTFRRPVVPFRLEHEDLRGHVGIEMDLRHEGDYLALERLLVDLDESGPHGVLEDRAGLADGIGASGVDQRSLDGRVDVLEHAHDVVALHDRADGGRTAAVMVAVEPGDSIGDRDQLATAIELLVCHPTRSPRPRSYPAAT